MGTMTGAVLVGFLFAATVFSLLDCYLSSARWQSLGMPPEQSSKICSVNHEALYVQTVTGKVYTHSYPSSWNNFREEGSWREVNPQEIGGNDCQKEQTYISWVNPPGFTNDQHYFKIESNGVVWRRSYLEKGMSIIVCNEVVVSSIIGMILGAILGWRLSIKSKGYINAS
jgi:hypothetical protein